MKREKKEYIEVELRSKRDKTKTIKVNKYSLVIAFFFSVGL
jgi:hypothetical protein